MAKLVVHNLCCLLLWATIGIGLGAKASRKSLQILPRRAKAGGDMNANLQLHAGDAPPSLLTLMDLVEDDMELVNSVLMERMQSEVPMIPQLADHLVSSGGKRMRPMLTLACAAVLEYKGRKHCDLAAAVEFIHTATLLHDDVVDGSDLRRSRPTANIIWGNSAAVLVGDFLFARAFELMVEVGSLRALHILSRASAVIAEGEVNQLSAQRQIETTEEQYLEIINGKTAELFAAASKIAAVVAERTDDSEERLDSFGRNLGMAFQMIDDAIDYISDEETMGKGVGDDFRDGKITLPVILAYARGDADERAFWQDAMAGNRVSDADLAYATTLLHKHDAVKDTMERARVYGQKAIDALAVFADTPAKAALCEAVAFAVARAY
jgi:octaprenyl-diphosphate synthase